MVTRTFGIGIIVLPLLVVLVVVVFVVLFSRKKDE